MAKLLLLEGNTAAARARGAAKAVRLASDIYAEAIAAHFPALELDVLCGADEGVNTPDWHDYAGLVITGSGLHAYDPGFAVANQIDLVRQAADKSLPIFGSCWGLQIAAMAAGGTVARCPEGREVGVARKITLTEAASAHPMFAAKGTGAAFDALCIHYDEVTRLPHGATVLATNAHSAVQAAVIPLGRSEIWAVQYHPEFDLAHMATLYDLYAEAMVAEGFFADAGDCATYTARLRALAADPANAGLAWQMGVDADILDERRRRAEIIAWVEAKVLPAVAYSAPASSAS